MRAAPASPWAASRNVEAGPTRGPMPNPYQPRSPPRVTTSLPAGGAGEEAEGKKAGLSSTPTGSHWTKPEFRVGGDRGAVPTATPVNGVPRGVTSKVSRCRPASRGPMGREVTKSAPAMSKTPRGWPSRITETRGVWPSSGAPITVRSAAGQAGELNRSSTDDRSVRRYRRPASPCTGPHPGPRACCWTVPPRSMDQKGTSRGSMARRLASASSRARRAAAFQGGTGTRRAVVSQSIQAAAHAVRGRKEIPAREAVTGRPSRGPAPRADAPAEPPHAPQVVRDRPYDAHGRSQVLDPVHGDLVDAQTRTLGQDQQLRVEEPLRVLGGGHDIAGPRPVEELEPALMILDGRAEEGPHERVVPAREHLAAESAAGMGAGEKPRSDHDVRSRLQPPQRFGQRLQMRGEVDVHVADPRRLGGEERTPQRAPASLLRHVNGSYLRMGACQSFPDGSGVVRRAIAQD